jgi:mono/diheme cytochrome c family protein
MTNLKVLAVVLLTLLAYTSLANMIPQVESEVPRELSFAEGATPEQLVSAGEELYAGAGGCTACHGLGTRAPNLLTDEGGSGAIGARCATRIAGVTCKEYLHQSMVEPNAHVVENYQPIMPDMRRTLSELQIWALVAYLESLGGEVTVTTEDLAQAEAASGGPAPLATTPSGVTQTEAPTLDPVTLLRDQTCLLCHKLGDEGGPVGPPFDGMGSRIGADQIRRGILEPNADTAAGYAPFAGTMPQTFGQQLTAAQLEAIVRYLSERN